VRVRPPALRDTVVNGSASAMALGEESSGDLDADRAERHGSTNP